MVAISEGTVIRQVRLFNKGSSAWVNVNDKGLVRSKEISDGYENLRFISEEFGKVKIYAEKSNRWLCYNKRWKLVGKLNGTEGRLGDRCLFSEEMHENHYYYYKAVRDPLRYVGFRLNGLPVRGRIQKSWSSDPYSFSKFDDSFNYETISKHNEMVSSPSAGFDRRSEYIPVRSGSARTEIKTPLRPARPTSRGHKHRHRHGNRRRKFPNNNTAAV